MKLLVINPNTSAFVTEKIKRCAEEAAGTDTTVLAVTGRKGVPIVGTRSECLIAAQEAMELAVEHASEADAILLGISFDTGLDEIREILSIPVIGMSEAGMLASCAVAKRFTMVTFGERAVPLYDELVDRYGFGARSAGTISLPPLSQDELENPELIVDALADHIGVAVRTKGAEAVVLAGAIFAGIAPLLKDKVSIPVVDGIVAGVGLARLLHSLDVKKPETGSYQFPGPKTLTGMPDRLTQLFKRFGEP